MEFKPNDIVYVHSIAFCVITVKSECVLLRLVDKNNYKRAERAQYHPNLNFWTLFVLETAYTYESPAVHLLNEYCEEYSIDFKTIEQDYYVWCKPEFIEIDPLIGISQKLRREINAG